MKAAIILTSSLSAMFSTVVTEQYTGRSLLTAMNTNGGPTSCNEHKDCTQRNGQQGVCVPTGAGPSFCVYRRADCNAGIYEFCECSTNQECVSGKCSVYPVIKADTNGVESVVWSDDPTTPTNKKRCEPALSGSYCLSALDCVSRTCVDNQCSNAQTDGHPAVRPCIENSDCQADMICKNELCTKPYGETCTTGELLYWEAMASKSPHMRVDFPETVVNNHVTINSLTGDIMFKPSTTSADALNQLCASGRCNANGKCGCHDLITGAGCSTGKTCQLDSGGSDYVCSV